MVHHDEIRARIAARLQQLGIDPDDPRLGDAGWAEVLHSLENQFNPEIPDDQAEKIIREEVEKIRGLLG